jgi:hypothetical protein
VARTRARAKGRYGGESEAFAYMPESVLQHPAMKDLPFAARFVLTALVSGKPRERNGLMILTDARARLFGIKSHGTLSRSLRALREHGFVIVTRRVQRLMRFATEHAVTWWPVYYRDGQALAQPEPATHAYRQWIAPPIGVKRRVGKTAARKSNTPTSGVNHPHHRGNEPALSPRSTGLEAGSLPLPSGDSNISMRGRGLRKPKPGAPRALESLDQKMQTARELLRTVPAIRNGELVSITGLTAEQVKEARGSAPDAPTSEAIA